MMQKLGWETWGAHLLALTVWREARGEGMLGMTAVAWCLRNRVERPKWWGATYGEVCTKAWQISSMTDPHDRQLTTWPKASDASFADALRIVPDVINGNVAHPAPGADSYYDASIPAPKWATPETFVLQLGRLRFHNTDHDHEMDAAIQQLARHP